MPASAPLRRAGGVLGAVVGAQMGSVVDARRFDDHSRGAGGPGAPGGESRRAELRRLRDACVAEVRAVRWRR